MSHPDKAREIVNRIERGHLMENSTWEALFDAARMMLAGGMKPRTVSRVLRGINGHIEALT